MRHVTWGRSGMYVIFPAEELILMTYGAAIPRISPRPTLDCLREPKVPIFLPARSKPSPKNNNIVVPVFAQLPQPVLLPITVPIQEAVVYTSSGEFNSLPPLPPKRSSLASLSRGNSLPKATVTFSTVTSLNTINSNTILPSRAPMYNDLNMQSPTSSSSSEPNTRRLVRGSTPLRLPATPPTSASSTLRVIPDDEELPSSLDYPKRERSPSIRLDLLPPDDPTRPKLGPGWGRPMSPMDLPPEPSTSAASTKSPKLRLKPKLHIPLGKLGRSASAEPKESNRLREDLQLHIENPIFKAENLRQRNFDVFFDAGEPVYKLQPKAPSSAPGGNPSDQYAGLYDSTLSRKVDRKGGSGGLFARSPREDKLLATPAKSTDVYVEPLPRGRAASVEPAAFSSGYGSTGSSTGGDGGRTPQKDFLGKSSSGRKNRSFFGWRGPRCGSLDPPTTSNSMASYTGVLKDYGHISLNEAFKSQNSINFKLIKTVSDFTESLSQLYEEHATALQTLVSNYRKKNAELRKERPSCHLSIFQAWETFMQEVETDSHASTDVATALSRQVSRPMLDKSFHRKVQSRKLFTHRESFETILAKTEEKLTKCRVDYKQCYLTYRQNPTQHNLSEYVDAHNAYVQQLHATNAMLETYHCDTVPQLMQELEEIHNDLYGIIADSILLGADFIANKATDQAKRYGNLTTQCNSISPSQDLQNFVHVLPLPSQAQKVPKRVFVPPQQQQQQPLPSASLVSSSGGSGVAPATAAIVDNDDNKDDLVATLRNELIYDRQSSVGLRAALDALKREAIDLEMQIRQLQDAVESLNRTQVRGIEGQLYNKVNEMQEELSIKKFDLRAKQLHLAAIKAQKELFISKVEPGSPRVERKFSTAATPPSMKTKWLKAIKSLKPASGSAAPTDRRNGAAGASSQTVRPTEDGSHHLQEYTYKKITACDVCSQILRGHTRQGLRCRICKLNAHGDCAAQLPRCQPKQKLLRRQKSTSELENRIEAEEEKLTDIQQVYRALKQAGDLKNSNHHITAEKSVQSVSKEGGSQTTDIPIVHVPDYPERSDRPAVTGSSSAGTSVHRESAASGSGRGVVVMRPGIRPPPVAMPILGVQLQQQELQRSGLGGGGVPTIAGVVSAALPVPAQDLSSSSAPHSPRRQKLNLRMKSLSLDSPESTELHGQMRRRQQQQQQSYQQQVTTVLTAATTSMTVASSAGAAAAAASDYYPSGSGMGSGSHLDYGTPPSNSSRLHSPSSPSHQGRKLLYATRGMRGGSMDLPDEMEKSQSSASTSPCPSPKSHRLLPTNLYVVLYNFKARHADELDLKAGYKVTVIDTSDPDWWKGKAMGRMGYFPSKYVVRLNANEKPLQVTHNLQVSDGERGDNMTLLRDQIVIQAGDELNGMILVRAADNRQGYCPAKYLQEV